MNSLVSILIPAYNAEKWLEATIRSALAQTWEPKEIIIVDDGSRDRTLDIARQFESNIVKVISQKNGGAAAARNTAFAASEGDFIQWLDADDLLAPDKIERQMNELDQTGTRRTLLSSSWGQFMYRANRARFVPSALWQDLSPAEFLLHKLEHRVFMQTAVWLVSRELSESAGPWDTTMISDDDGEYFCRVLLRSDWVKFVPASRVYYRLVGPSSLSYVGDSRKKLEALWNSMQLHIRYLLSLEDSERTRAACVQYLQNYLIYFYQRDTVVVSKIHELAKLLGGTLEEPTLSWKYSWINILGGWELAIRAQLLFPRLRWGIIRWWDKTADRIESLKGVGDLHVKTRP